MRILIVTGKLAEDSIRRQLSRINHEVDIKVLPLNVASFITPKYAIKKLQEMNLDNYDMIILPGTVNGDITVVEKVTGIKTFKGPLHAVDLPLIFDDDFELSKTIPASELLMDLRRKDAINEIKKTEKNWKKIMNSDGGILIGKGDSTVPVSNKLPMRVIAEIVNAPLLTYEDLKKRALYYESQGADIIDIGMLAGNPKPEKIPGIIKTIRESVPLPLSIDTLDTCEIKKSIDTGIDLILSIDAGNIDSVISSIGEEAVVVLPTNMAEGYLPISAEERVRAQIENLDKAQSYGLGKVIADLVVEPMIIPGLLEPLKAFQLFHDIKPKIPILFGIGNAVELIDADAIGVSATLCALAREAGANILHVPEHSIKTIGNVRDVVMASRMMFLSQRRETSPKDLGLDLLVLKEKRWKEEEYDPSNIVEAKVLKGCPDKKFVPDNAGWFRIQIDRNNNQILAIHYSPGIKDPLTIVKGTNAIDIYQTIIRNKLISKLDHAAYLGKELQKAEIALKLYRSYQQDEPLFS